MKIAVVTPTGDRRASLNRQSKYIARSTLPPETEPYWIVVDDGETPYNPPHPTGWEKTYFLRRQKDERHSSLVANLILGLTHALSLDPDFVLIWEDDDWYGSERIIEQMDMLLRGQAMHGYSNSLYYHIPLKQYRLMTNSTASLFEMAFQSTLLIPILDFLATYQGDGRGLDGKLWKKFSGKKNAKQRGLFHSVGLKGLPGRDGIGCGHTPKTTWNKDPSFAFLVSIIGEEDMKEILGG